MAQVIQLSRPGAGSIYVSVAAIAVIQPGDLGEIWQGIRARVQLFDGRWYRVSQRPEEIMQIISAHGPETEALPALGMKDDALLPVRAAHLFS